MLTGKIFNSSSGGLVPAGFWLDNSLDMKNSTVPERSLRPGRRFKFTRNAMRYTGDHNQIGRVMDSGQLMETDGSRLLIISHIPIAALNPAAASYMVER